MKTIRETAKQTIEDNLRTYIIESEMYSHINETGLYHSYMIDPDGTFWWMEHIDNHHTSGIEKLATVGGSRCNCDWCAEWSESQDCTGCATKEEFIEACVDNNITEYDMDDLFRAIDEIPYGYFEDEK